MKPVSTPLRIACLPSGETPWRELGPLAAMRRNAPRILVVPGRDVTARMAPVVGSTQAQRAAAALAALAPQLAAPPEDCVVSLGRVSEGRALACVASRAKLRQWREAARSHGFEPDYIVCDLALLPASGEGEASVALSGSDYLVRTSQFACSAPAMIADRLLAGLSRTQVSLDETLRICAGDLTELKKHAFPMEPDGTARPLPIRRLGATAASACLMAIAAPWITAMRTDAAAEALHRDMTAIAQNALPNARRIVDARAQLAAELEPWQADGELFTLVVLTLDSVAAVPNARLERLEARGGESLAARATFATPGDLDTLREKLALHGATLQEAPAGASQDGRPAYSLTIGRPT